MKRVRHRAKSFCFLAPKNLENTFGFEKYLTELPVNNRILMTKFRCRNHRLPIETGCRAQTQRDLRLCFHCNDIGDEYHYLL